MGIKVKNLKVRPFKEVILKQNHEFFPLFNNIRKMYFSHLKPEGVSERMWSVNLDASISGENKTQGGHAGCR